MLAGTDPDQILQAAITMSGVKKGWVNPFGDGNTGKLIIKILQEELEKG